MRCINIKIPKKLDINTILNLLITYNLTADELLLIYLTFLAQDEEGHPEYLSKGVSAGGGDRLRSLFESIKSKGLIKKDYNPSTYSPNDIDFNKNFLKSGLKNSGKMGQELFEIYPPFLTINGKLYSLKNIAKKYNTLDEFFFAYSSAIKHNPDTHRKVMDLLKGGIDNNQIKYGIVEFVVSQKGNELKYLKDNNLQNHTATSVLLDD